MYIITKAMGSQRKSKKYYVQTFMEVNAHKKTGVKYKRKWYLHLILRLAEVIAPADIRFGTSSVLIDEDIVPVNDYADELKIKLKQMYETVNDNLNISREKMKKKYDENIREKRIQSVKRFG